MLNWLLNKILPEASPAPVTAASAATPAAPRLQMPPTLPGLLRRRAVYNAHWQIAAYSFTLRELSHHEHQGEEYSHDEVLLCEIERLLEAQAMSSGIWLGVHWKNLPLLSQHHFNSSTAITIIAHGEPDWTSLDISAVLGDLPASYSIGATAKRWHLSQPQLGERLALIELNVQSPDFAVLSQQVSECRKIAPNAQLWVNDIDSREAAEACFQLGADYVSGRVFNWPQAQQLSFPDSFLRLNQVLNLVRQNTDAKIIAAELKSDPALSARLLRYVNSAALGLAQPISNLDQAIVVVGNQRLYRWLSLLLFSCKGDQELDQTLLETALTRARLMELAAATRFSASECELLFLTGLFSLLDFLLRVPRSVLLAELNPPAIISDTLQDKTTAFTPYLQLAERSELGWPPEDLLAQCQLDSAEFNRIQIDGSLWALSALAS